MHTLHILFDGSCGLCWRAVKRLMHEPAYFDLRFLPSDAPSARDRFPTLLDRRPDQVIAVADTGEVYRGPSAWIIILYALKRYRPLAMRLARPAWRPFADRAVSFIAHNRHGLSAFLGLSPDADILAGVRAAIAYDAPASPASSTCTTGACPAALAPPPLPHAPRENETTQRQP